ncbi:MAG TPA: hypothetical protein VK796_10985 [Cytophaga sp.]|nr:hypothetical protein [Cytophaga sp.]
MEKFTTEMIEQYLEGKLDLSERLQMEEAMEQNAELKEEVLLQQMLVQKIEEQALRTLIQDTHSRYIKGRTGSGFNWIIGALLVIIIVAGLIFFLFNTKNEKESDSKNAVQITNTENAAATLPVVEGALENIKQGLPEVPFMVYTFLAEQGATIKDPGSGARINVPANILINKDGKHITGRVTLKYREFRTQADIALSGIPMVYNGHNFNSAGMFEICALQDGDTLSIQKDKAISIDFVMTKNEAGTGFYALREANKQWEFIRSLDMGKEEKKSSVPIDVFNFQTGKVLVSLKDQFLRSLGYQKAVMEGRKRDSAIPSKPKKDFNTLFNNENYKQIAGSDTNTSNRIFVKEIEKEVKSANNESGVAAFFKRIFLTSGTLVIPLHKKAPAVDTCLSIVVKNKRYVIYENGNNIVMKELASLKGTQFVYDGKNVFADLTKQTFYDVSLTRDTTVENKFTLKLKAEGKFLTYILRLSKLDFTAYEAYEEEKRLRVHAYDDYLKLKEKEYQDAIKRSEARAKLMDSLGFYGKENIFRMARLIMTEDELSMSEDQWIASLDTNRSLRNRINAHLDSIDAYGDNADQYIEKLAKERKQNIEDLKSNQRADQQFIQRNTDTDAGHYFNQLVRNLQIRGFGVYNCDQVYRIQAPILVRGRYTTGNSIDGKLRAISLIDPKVNAAFSFDPDLFTCSASGDNMILLFTTDDKIYFFDKAKWKAKQIKRQGTYTFEMIDITALVKSSADLQRIIEGSLL